MRSSETTRIGRLGLSAVETHMYIVQYDDPDRPSDGIRKTRQFSTQAQAESFVGRLGDHVSNVRIIHQITKTIREVL